MFESAVRMLCLQYVKSQGSQHVGCHKAGELVIFSEDCDRARS